MNHRTAVTACALIALVAICATSASTASAARLTLSEGGTALAPGDAFEIYGVENFEVSTSSGGLGCEPSRHRNGFEVSVLTNSNATDELQIDRLLGDYEESCRSFTGNAFVELRGVGGPLKLRGNGKASTGPVAVFIEFEHVRYGTAWYEDVECVYAHNSLKGSNTAGATPQKLEVELGAGLKLDVSGSGAKARQLCPKSADVTLSMEMTENGAGENEVIEAEG